MGFLSKNPLAHAVLLVLPLSFILLFPSTAQSQSSEFKLLELEQAFRSQHPDPSTAEGRKQVFALAEARFDNRLSSSQTLFQQLERPDLADALDWTALIYRIKASAAPPAQLENRLRDALAGRGFFAVFDEKRSWQWVSPTGHRFTFREYVDRLEIDRDDASFFTLQLG